MEYTIECDCGRTYQVQESQAGSQVSCTCGRMVTLPRQSESPHAAPELEDAVEVANPYQAPVNVTAERDEEHSDQRVAKRPVLYWISGRARRLEYWLVMMFGNIAAVTLDLVAEGAGISPWATLIPLLAIAWLMFATTVRRWHDRDKPATWLLLPVIALAIGAFAAEASDSFLFSRLVKMATLAVSLWFAVELAFMPGTVGENDYGPDPIRRKGAPRTAVESELAA